ncbi:metallophosphoesterase family protein [Desulfocurvus sp. DL9XJH121]
MRFAVLSDVHANLEALTAVLQDLDRQDVERIFFLGDAVGYGPDPEPCVALLRERGAACVLGNHEHALIRPAARAWFNPSARQAVDVAVGQASEDSLAWMRTLPSSLAFGRYRFVHGFPRDNAFLYLYATDEERLKRGFTDMGEDLCFVGHSHMLERVVCDAVGVRRLPLMLGVTALDPSLRHIVNVGSVGQPRDDVDYRAKYAVFDEAAWTLEMRAVDYDWRAVARRIRELGIPSTYANRLAGPGNL